MVRRANQEIVRRRSPRLAATAAVKPSSSTRRVSEEVQSVVTDITDTTDAKSFEVELDIRSVLGAITERMFEHTSHRLFEYYTDLISSTYDRSLQLDYTCSLFEFAIQTMTLTKDAKKREILFKALAALNESVFGMMDIPLAKKIRLSTVIRHLQKL